jgi:enoyl-CoA hydratase/carnithine racemase
MAVTLEVDGAVAILGLARPDRHNAFDRAQVDELGAAAAELEARGAALRAVIVHGAGRSFSSGADLKVLETVDADGARRFMMDATAAFRRLACLPVPVIAEVRGYCLGGGFELLLHTDLAIASEDAQLGLPEAPLGLTTTAGSVARLIDAVGSRRARELLLSGRRVGAAEALALGLVAEVVAADRLEATTRARAQAFAAMPAEGLAATKRLLSRELDARADASYLAEVEAFEALLRARGARR